MGLDPIFVVTALTTIVGVAMLFLTLATGDFFFLPSFKGAAGFLHLLEPVLLVAATALMKRGWKLPPEPVKNYRLEGWPPPTGFGSR
ncbi:MAG: hypothetical protein ABI401_05150 [Candidatus Dormibacter sp.]